MKLFVSYGREDDEAFVKRLCQDLAAKGIDAWQNDVAWSRYCVAKLLIRLIRIKDGDRNEARRLVTEGIDIMTRLEHRSALETDAQDALNKLNEIAAVLTSSSRN